MQLTPVGSVLVGREEGVCMMLYLADLKKSSVQVLVDSKSRR